MPRIRRLLSLLLIGLHLFLHGCSSIPTTSGVPTVPPGTQGIGSTPLVVPSGGVSSPGSVSSPLTSPDPSANPGNGSATPTLRPRSSASPESGSASPTPTPAPGTIPVNGVVILSADQLDGSPMTVGQTRKFVALAGDGGGRNISDQIVWSDSDGKDLAKGSELVYRASVVKMETLTASVAGKTVQVSMTVSDAENILNGHVKVLPPQVMGQIAEMDYAKGILNLKMDYAKGILNLKTGVALPTLKAGDWISSGMWLSPSQVVEVKVQDGMVKLKIKPALITDMVKSGIARPMDLSSGQSNKAVGTSKVQLSTDSDRGWLLRIPQCPISWGHTLPLTPQVGSAEFPLNIPAAKKWSNFVPSSILTEGRLGIDAQVRMQFCPGLSQPSIQIENGQVKLDLPGVELQNFLATASVRANATVKLTAAYKTNPFLIYTNFYVFQFGPVIGTFDMRLLGQFKVEPQLDVHLREAQLGLRFGPKTFNPFQLSFNPAYTLVPPTIPGLGQELIKPFWSGNLDLEGEAKVHLFVWLETNFYRQLLNAATAEVEALIALLNLAPEALAALERFARENGIPLALLLAILAALASAASAVAATGTAVGSLLLLLGAQGFTILIQIFTSPEFSPSISSQLEIPIVSLDATPPTPLVPAIPVTQPDPPLVELPVNIRRTLGVAENFAEAPQIGVEVILRVKGSGAEGEDKAVVVEQPVSASQKRISPVSLRGRVQGKFRFDALVAIKGFIGIGQTIFTPDPSPLPTATPDPNASCIPVGNLVAGLRSSNLPPCPTTPTPVSTSTPLPKDLKLSQPQLPSSALITNTDTYKFLFELLDNGNFVDQDSYEISVSGREINHPVCPGQVLSSLSDRQETITIPGSPTDFNDLLYLPGVKNTVRIKAISFGSFDDAATLEMTVKAARSAGITPVTSGKMNLPILSSNPRTYEIEVNCLRPDPSNLPGDSATLGVNLINHYGLDSLPCGTDTHHIVGSGTNNLGARQSREILYKYGLISSIDGSSEINEWWNGVYLPSNAEAARRIPGTIHNTGNHPNYWGSIFIELQNVLVKSYSPNPVPDLPPNEAKKNEISSQLKQRILEIGCELVRGERAL